MGRAERSSTDYSRGQRENVSFNENSSGVRSNATLSHRLHSRALISSSKEAATARAWRARARTRVGAKSIGGAVVPDVPTVAYVLEETMDPGDIGQHGICDLDGRGLTAAQGGLPLAKGEALPGARARDELEL
eukprot:CAMPEP_0177426010 /NCGR_PEP_ID=MMETSP0368-20130122/73313_1 /TAXON_ID=447022 ORGANISM="Scrippsiella hangoei-like, Strain SHHI-4" /NCGR_SAMPLE_ID=MMETSP0368 /ASSEMBLY_ACC=CAM_ASM_000363 /LENGTH=132 /DNA_ID=CAMNT_0018896345 /DNA_START=77 /DNA_END=476 /DNA_ORIENTATION=+